MFYDAFNAIKLIRTNLDVQECYFTNSNAAINPTAIYASGRRKYKTDPDGNYTINIGGYPPFPTINSTTRLYSNDFVDYKNQIQIFHNYETKILTNKFLGGSTDINIAYIRSKAVEIIDNNLDNFHVVGISLHDNVESESVILNNQFNKSVNMNWDQKNNHNER